MLAELQKRLGSAVEARNLPLGDVLWVWRNEATQEELGGPPGWGPGVPFCPVGRRQLGVHRLVSVILSDIGSSATSVFFADFCVFVITIKNQLHNCQFIVFHGHALTDVYLQIYLVYPPHRVPDHSFLTSFQP